MGFPPRGGSGHRQHEPDIGASRTNLRDCDAVTVAIPMPRTPVDPPTMAIRHVVMPPLPAHEEAGGGQWGVALGIAVVVTCAAYIVVAGVGGLHGETVGPPASTLSRPGPSATFPASAVAPAPAVEPTSAAASAPTRARAAVATALPTTGPRPEPTTAQDGGATVQGDPPTAGAPQLAGPPRESPAQGSDPQPGAEPTAAPPAVAPEPVEASAS